MPVEFGGFGKLRQIYINFHGFLDHEDNIEKVRETCSCIRSGNGNLDFLGGVAAWLFTEGKNHLHASLQSSHYRLTHRG